MSWALGVSLVLNGALLGFVAGVVVAQNASQQPPVENDVPGGGISQDPDMDYVWDPTITGKKVMGFKGPNGK
jgi:hypothetical protein